MTAQNETSGSSQASAPASTATKSKRQQLREAREANAIARLDLTHSIEQLLVKGVIRLAEVMHALEVSGKKSPHTNEPWPKATVWREMEAIRARWVQSTQDIEAHYASTLAEIEELRRGAWNDKNGVDRSAILAALDRKCKLLGLDRPMKIAHTTAAGDDVDLGPTVLVVKVDTAKMTVQQMLWLDEIVSQQQGTKTILGESPREEIASDGEAASVDSGPST
jgi:hypothetical protein